MFGTILPLAALVVAAAVNAQVNLDNVTGGCVPGGCSGHGSCNINAVCVCDDLWSSNADFIIVEDCTLSVIGIIVLWAITLSVCLLVFYKTAWVVAARFENFYNQRKLTKGYTLMKNPGLIAVLFLYGLSVPSVMISAVVHFIDPTTRVAFDALPTSLFFLAKTGLWMGAMFLQGPLLAIALKGEHAFDGLVKFNFRFNIFLNILAIFIGGIPFVTLMHFQTDIPKQFEVIRAYYFGQAIVLGCQFLESYLVKLRLNYALRRANGLISSDRSSSILAKVNAAQDTIIKSAFIQCVINVLMGAVPFLLNKHAYFLPMSWIAIPLIGKNVALQIELDKKGTKTIAQRFKMLVNGTSQTSGQNDPTSPSSNTHGYPQITSGKVAASENPGSSTMFEAKNPIMAKQQASQIGSTDGMQELLDGDQSDENKKKFADFVRSRYASETLNFYDAVTEYEKAGRKDKKKKGDAIIKRFIADASVEAIDFPSEMKEQLLAAQKAKDFRDNTFGPAKQVSFDLLKSNFYHKFKESMEA